MAKQKSQASNRPAQHATNADNKAKQHEQEERDQADEANKVKFGVDTGGVVAQDLPDAQHGQNAVPDAHEMKRNLPHQHGGEILNDPHAEGGMRGDRKMSDADDHGGRKHN